MKRLFSSILIILILTLVIAPAAFASDDDQLVYDEAGILTEAQLKDLNNRAEAITEKYKCEVVIYIVKNMYDYKVDRINGDSYATALNKAIYKDYGYGYGADKSCLIFCLSMADRDYALESYGYGNTAFTIHGVDVMLDKHVLPLLKDNKFYDAFSLYLNKSDDFLKMARDGKPFDKNTDPDYLRSQLITKLAVIIIIPSLISFVLCTIWKAQMKTARIARAADNYIPPGGFKLTGQTDKFLYKTTARRKIESSSSGSSSRSSSGRSGKF